jgi:hypothetical protein
MDQTWQPIETAPRDGSKMLFWFPYAGVDIGVFIEGQPYASHYAMGVDFPLTEPLYWMPLPPIPGENP